MHLWFDFQKHASHIPPIVKLMASQNDTMREEIHKQKRVIIFYLKIDIKVYYWVLKWN